MGGAGDGLMATSWIDMTEETNWAAGKMRLLQLMLFVGIAAPLCAAVEKPVDLRKAPEAVKQYVDAKVKEGGKVYRITSADNYYRMQLAEAGKKSRTYVFNKEMKLLYSYGPVTFNELPVKVQDQIQDNAEVVRKRSESKNASEQRKFKRKKTGLKMYTLAGGKDLYFCRWQTQDDDLSGYFDNSGTVVKDFTPID